MLCIAFLAVACSVNAQKFKKNVSFGPIIGLGHAWMTGMAGDKEFKFAPSGGLTLVYSAGEHWGFGMDAKFSREGVKLEAPLPGTQSILNSHYIRVPFKAMYFFGQLGDNVRPKIMGGPSLGFLVGGKQRLETTEGETLIETKTKEVVRGFDIGFNGSVGVNIRLTQNAWLNTDVTYYHGLRNVSKNDGQDWKNRNIGLNLGVAFGIGTIKPD